jgi:hypothetical protein
MPGLVPGIHVLRNQDVDGRDKPGHDGVASYDNADSFSVSDGPSQIT